MSEAEIVAEFALRADRIWSITQWWASITFAVLLAAHVGVDTLNRVIVAILTGLYSLFSFWIAQILWSNMKAGGAALESLREVSEKVDLSPIGANLIEDDVTMRGMTMIATLSITFLSTIFYVTYSFLKRRHTT